MKRLKALLLIITLLTPMTTLSVMADSGDATPDAAPTRPTAFRSDLELPGWFTIPTSPPDTPLSAPPSPSPEAATSPEAAVSPPVRGRPADEQLFPTPPPPPEGPGEGEEIELPPDPRYIPVLPPDPDRQDEQSESDAEFPPEESGIRQMSGPLAPTADCTAESDLGIIWHTLEEGGPSFGEEIEYQISFENQGNAAARDVRITDTLPLSVTYVSDSPPKGFTTVITTGGQVVWARQTPVNPGESGTALLRLRVGDTVPAGTVLTNTVVITTSDPDTDPGDNSSTRTDTVAPPTRDMYVYKSLNSGTPLAGGEIVYWLYFQNQGNSIAHDVLLTDTLPVSATYVSWYGYGDDTIVPTIADGQVVWPIGEVAGGDSGSIYLTVHISETAPVGGVLTNTAVITTSDPDTYPDDNGDDDVRTIAPPERDMYVSKSRSSGDPLAGGEIVYRLYFENQGNSVARDVLLTDTLPVSVTYVSWYGYAYNPYYDIDRTIVPTIADGRIVWPLGEVEAGQYGYIYLTVHISETAPVGGVLINTAVITTSDPDTDPGDNGDDDVTTIVAPTRDVRVTKYLDSGTPLAGGEIVYRLYFRNDGNSVARDVLLTDTLPASVAYVSWSSFSWKDSHELFGRQIEETVIAPANQIVWPIGEVAGGDSGNIYLTVRVADTVTVGSLLTNTAVITTSDPDTNPTDNSSVRSDDVVTPTRDVRVTKSLDSGTPLAGGEIRYRLDFRNDGNSAAHDVLLTDTLPANVTYVSWYGYAWDPYYDIDRTIVPTIADGQIVWPLGEVDAGQYGYINLRVHVADDAAVRDVLCNHASISTSDGSNDVVTHTTTVYHPIADLAVEKSVHDHAGAPGGNMMYKIEVKNLGVAPLHDVLVTDTLPSGVTLVSWSGGPPRLIETPDGKLVWELGTLEGGSTKYIYLTVHLDAGLSVGDLLTNTVAVAGVGDELDRRDNEYVLTTEVLSPTRDMYVSKSLMDALVPGELGAYDLYIGNTGNFTATGVILTDTLPPSTTLVSWSGLFYNPQRLIPAPTIQDGQLIWRLGEVLAGQYAYLSLVLQVDEAAAPGDKLTNTAVITLTESDANPTNNEDSSTDTVLTPERDLYVAKSRSSSLPTPPGGELTYLINFGNLGNARARDVVITDTLPPSVTYVSWDGYVSVPYYGTLEHLITPTIAGRQVVWRLPEIPAGKDGWIDLTVRVDDTLPVGGLLTNTVAIATRDSDSDLDNNVYTHTETVTRTWDVRISKSLGGAPLAGGEVVYQLQFENEGNMPATDVVLTDTWPLSVTYLSWEGELYNPDMVELCDEEAVIEPANRRGRWEIGTLQPGGRGSIYLTVRIADDISVGEQIVNVASIAMAESEADTSDNVYTSTDTIVVPTRDLYVSKSMNAWGAPGGLMRYRLYFANNGNSVAHDVLLTDTLPASVTYASWYGYTYNPYVDLDETITPTVADGRIVWPLGETEAGQYGYIYLTVRIADGVKKGDVLVNQVGISTSDEETSYSNNDASSTYRPTAVPDLEVYKYLNSPPGAAGSWMRYHVSVENTGSYTATNVILTDTLPLSASLASWSGESCVFTQDGQQCNPLSTTPIIANGQIIWSLGDIGPGDTVWLYITVNVEEEAVVWQHLGNSVIAVGDNTESEYEYNRNSDHTRVTLPWVDLYIDKYLAKCDGMSAPGEEMDYYLYFGNEGNITATNTLITDALPAGTEYVSWRGYMWHPDVDLGGSITPTVAAGNVVWPLGDVPPGSYGYIYLTVRLTDTLTVCLRLTNTAMITGSEEDFSLANNLSRITTRVAQVVPLSGVTISGPTAATVGQDTAFVAVVSPVTATVSNYTWSSEHLVGGQGTSSATYNWPQAGRYTITVRAENTYGVVSDTHTIVITEPPPCIELTGVTIAGPTGGYVDTLYTFDAAVAPSNATPPIAYTWSADPPPGTLLLPGPAQVRYGWATTGTKTITVTAENCDGVQVSDVHTITLIAVSPISTTVDQDTGDTLVYTDAQGLTTTVEIPAGAVSETTTIVFTPVPSPTQPISTGLRFGNHSFDLEAYRGGVHISPFPFTGTVTVTIHYSDADVAGIEESDLALYRWIEGAPGYWERIGERAGEGQTLDMEHNVLTAWLRGLSRFGVLGTEKSAFPIYLPLVMRNHE